MYSRKDFLTHLAAGIPLSLAAGTGFAAASADESDPARIDNFVSAKDFGAVGDGKTDDTKAIQDAVDTRRNVYFTTGMYLVTKQITIAHSGQTLFSYGTNPSKVNLNSANIIAKKDIEGSLFLVTGHMNAFIGLGMMGPGKLSQTTAIQFRKGSNSDDVDAKILNCTVKHFRTGVRLYGRGLRVGNNSFAVITDVLQIEWPAENAEGERLQVLPYGMRALFIYNNRVHTCTTFVVNEGPEAEHLWGMSLTGNLMDIGECLFRGSATYSAITDNVVCHANRTTIYFKNTCHTNVIANNVLSGSDLKDWDQPAHGIWIEGKCHDVTISGNVFAQMRQDAILFNAEVQEHVVINGNVFNQVGHDRPGERGVIRFAKPARNCSIMGNSFRPGSDGAAVCIAASENSLSGFQVIGNVCEPGKPLMSIKQETTAELPEAG